MKQSGLGDNLYIGGYDISGDVGSIDRIASPSGVLDVTGVNASGHERIHSHFDGEIVFNHFFNDGALAEFVANKAKGSGADRVAMYFHGSTLGNVAAAMVAKQINYDWTRGADGSLTGPVQLLANEHGLEWCDQLTAGKRTDTEATTGASVNNSAATELGLAAYLQVFVVAGTSCTVKIEHSTNDADWDDLITFSTVNAGSVLGERMVTGLTDTIRQYLRVTTTGTFSNAIFALCVTRVPYA